MWDTHAMTWRLRAGCLLNQGEEGKRERPTLRYIDQDLLPEKIKTEI
jgi:hypothetical protein